MVRRAAWPRGALLAVAIAALPGGPTALAQEDSGEPASPAAPAAPAADEQAGNAGQDGSDASGTPARRRHASEYPLGVTVLVPVLGTARHASDFPPGVTVLDPAPLAGSRAERATVRVRTRLTTGDGVVVIESAEETPGTAPPPETPGPERPQTAGPPRSEQLAVFGEQPVIAAPSAAYEWSPVSAWADRDSPEPYPWQPATFAQTAFDPVWRPESAWPPREPDDAYPWHPARWSAPTFDTSWTPRDAWGRTVIVSPAGLDATVARRGPQPDGEPANPTPRGVPPAEAEPAQPPKP